MRRSLLMLLLPPLGAFLASAADAPVPVVKEPYHKTAFENQYVRILDVQFDPGVTTLYHVHDIASVVVYLTRSTNASQTWGETDATPRQTTPGDSRYAPYDEKPLTHRVTNTGDNHFRVFDIELLRKPWDKPFPPAPTAAQPRWEQKRVRSSNLVLDAGATAQLPPTFCGQLIIGIRGDLALETGAPKSTTVGFVQPLKPQNFLFFMPETAVLVRNRGKEQAEAVLLEVK